MGLPVTFSPGHTTVIPLKHVADACRAGIFRSPISDPRVVGHSSGALPAGAVLRCPPVLAGLASCDETGQPCQRQHAGCLEHSLFTALIVSAPQPCFPCLGLGL